MTEIYNLAQLTAVFVCGCLNGNELPTFEEVFPIYKTEAEEPKEEINWELYRIKEQLMDFQRGRNSINVKEVD